MHTAIVFLFRLEHTPHSVSHIESHQKRGNDPLQRESHLPGRCAVATSFDDDQTRVLGTHGTVQRARVLQWTYTVVVPMHDETLYTSHLFARVQQVEGCRQEKTVGLVVGFHQR